MLTRYGLMAKESWAEERPKMYLRLEESGSLELALENAQQLARAEKAALLRRGTPPEIAEEQALAMFILLPSEMEVPVLSADEQPFSRSETTTGSPTPSLSESAMSTPALTRT